MDKLITLITICVSFMSAIASVIAVRYTFLAYKRDQKFHNENFIFQTKFKSYSLIIGSLNRLITQFQVTLEEMDDSNDEELNQMADDIDELIYEFDDLVSEHSFSMSNNILESLKEIIELMLLSIEEEDDRKLNIFINEVIDKSNSLADKMREELHVDNLTFGLTKRIKSK